MCGIAGIWFSQPRETGELESIGRNIGASMQHRGPDGEGVWSGPSGDVLLVHRRLSILDTTSGGSQPMTSSDLRHTIIFNGEIYNYREIRDLLAGLGCRFRGESDTEVLLAACSHWGAEETLRRLNGMFAFALWDNVKRTLFLARDPIGIKPLYYGWSDGNFIFGSELRALRAIPGFDPAVDRSSLGMYFKHNYIPAPQSIYEDVFKLSPGHWIELAGPTARPEPVQFWTPRAALSEARAAHANPSDAINELNELLLRAVRSQMVSDVPLGAFLSGGVDSSVVVALAQGCSSRPVKTFAMGFEEAEFDESGYASAVAAHLGTEHHQMIVTPDSALDLVPGLPAILDEPLADASVIPTYLVSQFARHSVTVSLSGDGGDELFMGYNHCLQAWQRLKTLEKIPKPVREVAGRLLSRSTNEKLAKYGSVLRQRDTGSTYASMTSHWHHPEDIVVNLPPCPSISPAILGPLEAVTLWDIEKWLPDDVLAKVDRASMAVSLEARVPLLDLDVVEFALRLPQSLKVRNGMRKWLLRQVLYRYVPAELVDRPKQGFSVPVSRWLRGPLRPWAEDLLSEASLESHGYLHSAPIRLKWRQHLAGTHCWPEHLWSVLMFQAWLAEWHNVGPASK